MRTLQNPFATLPGASLDGKSFRQVLHPQDAGEGILSTSDTRARPLPRGARATLLMLCMVVGFLLLVARVFALQLASEGAYRESAEGNRIRAEVIVPPRGLFLDRKNVPLVHNEPLFSVITTANQVPETPEARMALAQKLAAATGASPDELNTRLEEARNVTSAPSTLIEDIPYDKALFLRVHGAEFPQASVHISARRVHTDPEAFSNLLGYVGKISKEEREGDVSYSLLNLVGKTGAEQAFENTVRGVNGFQYIEQNSFSEAQRTISQEAPVPGENVQLAIDAELQKTLFQSLKRSVEAVHSTGGAAVAMDPKTGEVLALVSYPTYDAHAMANGLSQEAFAALQNDPRHPFLFRPLMGEYPSGSTIKPVIAAAALQEQVITDRTTVQSVGGIRINDWYFPDWKAGGHGTTDVRKALAESVNTFFYLIGGGGENMTGLGVRRITDYAHLFGLGERLGIDLPGERPGFLPTREWKEETKGERWYIGDTYHLAIGQGDLLVTPLQVAAYTATIANGGTLYRPHLMHAVTDPENAITHTQESEIIREGFLAPEYLEVVRQGMRQAVTGGSARALGSLSVTSAGKTGTAQAPQGATHAWFTSFAPYEDPQIVITVLVEHGGEGGDAALPVARDGFTQYFSSQVPAGG